MVDRGLSPLNLTADLDRPCVRALSAPPLDSLPASISALHIVVTGSDTVIMRSSPFLMASLLMAVAFMTLKVHGFAPSPLVPHAQHIRRMRSSDTPSKGDAGSMLRREGCFAVRNRSEDDRETADRPNGMPAPCLSALAPVVFGRRLTFLLISLSVVNFIRSSILKIPKSTTGMFDECPWPFTLAHDPKKFFKTGATHVTILWAILCWTYGRFGMAFLAVPK